MFSKKVRVAALLASAALVVAACGSDDDAATTTQPAASATTAPEVTTAESTAPAGTTPDTTMAEESGGIPDVGGDCDATVPGSQVNYGVFAPNSAFDPTGSSGALVGGTELSAVYDVLFIFNPTTLEVTPHLAESLTANDDTLTEWTLKLRDGITYSDGTQLTAQLVSDNIDRYFATEGVRNTSAGFLQYIDTRTVVDDLTLDMTLNTPVAEFALFFADEPGMVVNTNAIGADLDAFRAMPPDAAGVGPYVVERNVPGEETVLKARSDYWGGNVCIETLRFVFIPGAQPTYDAFTNGELDVAFLRDPVVNKEATDAGTEGFFFNQDGGAMLNFNHREGFPTSDARIREAVSLVLDPEIINDRAFQGALQTTKAYFGPDSAYFSDAIVPVPVDAARAAELITEAKADGWDGTLKLNGSSEGTGPDVVLAVQGMLESIGITVTAEQLPTVENIAKLREGTFDVILNGFNSGPGTAVLSLVRNMSSTSPTNRMGYSSPTMDGLLDDALATPFEDLKPVMAKINDQINTDFAAQTYAVTSEGAVWQDNVTGIVPTVSSIFLFHAASLSD